MMKKLTITSRYNYDEICDMLPLGESFCVNSLTVNYLGNDRYELSDDDYDMTITASGDEICKYIYASVLRSDIVLEKQNILRIESELMLENQNLLKIESEIESELAEIKRCLNALIAAAE